MIQRTLGKKNVNQKTLQTPVSKLYAHLEVTV